MSIFSFQHEFEQYLVLAQLRVIHGINPKINSIYPFFGLFLAVCMKSAYAQP